MILMVSSLLSVLWLSSPEVLNVASGQGQMTEMKMLERGDDGQCALMEEIKRARNEIHQIANSAITAVISTYSCNGTAGWSQVFFIFWAMFSLRDKKSASPRP